MRRTVFFKKEVADIIEAEAQKTEKTINHVINSLILEAYKLKSEKTALEELKTYIETEFTKIKRGMLNLNKKLEEKNTN